MSGIVGSKLNIRGSGRVAKLGTDGQVLTSAGAGVSAVYEDAAGGGAWNLLITTTASGASEANFVHGSGGVDLTTYKMYKLLGMDIHVSDSDSNPIVLWSNDTGGSYSVSGYETSELYITYGGAVSVNSSTSVSLFMNNLGNNDEESGTFEFTFPNPSQSSVWQNSFWCGVGSPATGNARFMFGSSVWKSASVVDALQFKIDSGTFDGTLKLYGLS